MSYPGVKRLESIIDESASLERVMKRIGKQGKINIKANKILKQIYQEKDICSCEIGLVGCTGGLFCGFAHKHKRVWYYGCPELLASYNETVLACSSCHLKMEFSKEETERVFKELRP